MMQSVDMHSLMCLSRTFRTRYMQRCVLLLLAFTFLPNTAADRIWRRERGSRSLNQAGQHQRQDGTALVAVMVRFGVLLGLDARQDLQLQCLTCSVYADRPDLITNTSKGESTLGRPGSLQLKKSSTGTSTLQYQLLRAFLNRCC